MTTFRISKLSPGALLFSFGALAEAATLQVGPGKTYAAPCDAIAAAAAGDIIEVDASGNYDGDVCGWSKNNLTIRGVGGRAKIDAAGQNAQGKAIWVIGGNDTTIENIELSGATVPDQNGAGIRQEGQNLTVRNCFFHDNEDGILAGDSPGSEILIEYSEFDSNGYGDGYSHNLYINHIAKLTFRFNWSHRASIGHLLKSRAAENHILYNRLTGESTGTESYEIDLPNGGKSYVIGNLIEQGPSTDNPTLLAYRQEGANAANPSTELFVVNNTFVNDKGSGTFVSIQSAVSTPAILKNNVFFGGGSITNQASAVQANNYSGATPMLANVAGYDYQLLTGSPCVDMGADPGSGGGLSLTPNGHYVHPTSGETRASVGTIDIGAYELGGGSAGTGGSATGGGGSAGSANGGSGGSSNGGSGGSSNGGSSNGGSSNGGSSNGGSSNGGSGTGAASGNGGSKSGGADSGDDGGCGCRIPAQAPASRGLLLVSLVGFALLGRRRRILGTPKN